LTEVMRTLEKLMRKLEIGRNSRLRCMSQLLMKSVNCISMKPSLKYYIDICQVLLLLFIPFIKAIKQHYPSIQLITSTGYSPNPQFKYIDSVLSRLNVGIIDEHSYRASNWFLMNDSKYNNYDRKGSKIFLGEYSCNSARIGSQENKNTLLCALSEAAFITGLERNADIVTMCAYSPLFAHSEVWQWTTNLIWFDNSFVLATPKCYVQWLFSRNRGTHVVPLLQDGSTVVTEQTNCYAPTVIGTTTKELILKLMNAFDDVKQCTINLLQVKKKKLTGTLTILKDTSPNEINTLCQSAHIEPEIKGFYRNIEN
jgi:alpha-N-arabinofuranosidase